MNEKMEIKKYEKHYSESKLLDKIKSHAKVAGLNIVYIGLILFYTLENPKLPVKIKSIIMGGLGYFIFPIDLIPDLAPVVGYSDDLGILMGVLLIAAFYIDEDVKKKAKTKLKDLFGDYDEDIVKEINKKIEKASKKQ